MFRLVSNWWARVAARAYAAAGMGQAAKPVSSLDYAKVAAAEAKKQNLSFDAANALTLKLVLIIAGSPKGDGWTGQGVFIQFRRLVGLADEEAQRAAWELEIATLQAGDGFLARATVQVEPTSVTIGWG